MATRKVKQVSNVNIIPNKIKTPLRDNINNVIENEPEVLNETLYDEPQSNKTLQKEELYDLPTKTNVKPIFIDIYTSVEKEEVTNLGSLYDIKDSNSTIVLDNVNEKSKTNDKTIKNQKIDQKIIKENKTIANETISLNQNNNRQTLINQLVAENQQIIAPILPQGQDL